MDRGLAENITNSLSKICQDVILKCAASSVSIIYAFSFGTAQGKGLLALLILIIADFFTAIWAAYKTGEAIKSAKIFRTVVKIVIYFFMISLAHMSEEAIPVLSSVLDETVLAFLAVTELISNLENFGRIGFMVPRKLLNSLKSFKNNK